MIATYVAPSAGIAIATVSSSGIPAMWATIAVTCSSYRAALAAQESAPSTTTLTSSSTFSAPNSAE